MALIDMGDEDLLARILYKTRDAGALAPKRATPAPRTEPSDQTWNVPGILGSTRITTTFGHVPAHLVRVGDSLRTRDGEFLRVLRISEYKFDDDFLARRPDAAPVVIRKGSLGPHMPLQDVAVSPAQKISLAVNRVEGRLVPAVEVSEQRGGVDHSLGLLVYFKLHLSKRALICCDGVWVEAESD